MKPHFAVPHFAVIGAGIAGIACARELSAAGMAVTVYDKGRRPGGRLASRTIEGVSVDHGAPCLSAPGPEVAALPDTLPWTGPDGAPARVGVPGMAAWAAGIAGDVLSNRHVSWLCRDAAGWHIRHHHAQTVPPSLVTDTLGELAGPFDGVALTIPAPQAARLLRAMQHRLADPIASIRMDPCWTLMLALAETADAPDLLATDGPLGIVIRDSAKPGRVPGLERWVAHASLPWSTAHLEDDPDPVRAELCQAFAAVTGCVPAHAAVHRWRYAQPRVALEVPCLIGPDQLAYAGDGCAGHGANAAFTSGAAAAAALLAG